MSRAAVRRIGSGAALAAVLIGAVSVGRRNEAEPALRGPGGAVVFVEYSDYECPACRKASGTVKAILDHFGAKVQWVHKNFPLERVHPFARAAAISAVCAERQGKLRPYHELLYDRQDQWVGSGDVSGKFVKYAEDLGMDKKAFGACLKDPASALSVDKDVEEGRRLDIHSTPTFFIGRHRLAGSQQLLYDGSRLIEQESRP